MEVPSFHGTWLLDVELRSPTGRIAKAQVPLRWEPVDGENPMEEANRIMRDLRIALARIRQSQSDDGAGS